MPVVLPRRLLLVLECKICALDRHQDPSADEETHDERVGRLIRRRLRGGVDKRGHEAAAVCDSQLQPDGRCTGIMVRIVARCASSVSKPCQQAK